MKLADMPTLIDTPFAADAASDYVRAIPDTTVVAGAASYSLGFPPLTATPLSAGGIPPDIKDMNGILRALSQWTNWLNAGAPVAYDSAFAAVIGGYPLGSILASTVTSGKLWRSTVDDNVNDPDVTPTGWEPAINAASIKNGSVGTSALADGGVTNAKLAAGGFSTVKGRAASGSQTDLTMSQVVGLLNTAGGIAGAALTNASVTNAKLVDGPTSTVKGRNTSGTTTDLTMSQLAALLLTATTNANGTALQIGSWIVQFGEASNITSGPLTVTFPIPFPTACTSVVATPIVISPSSVDSATVSSKTTTAAVINRRDASGTKNWNLFWVAFGN